MAKTRIPRSTEGRRPPPGRGRLRSMKSSSSFAEFALEQLAGIKGIRAKAMFGGIGLYADDVFFGLMAADTLYLKVDDSNRRTYDIAGSKAFQPYADRPMTMPYYNVPAGILEDPSELVNWARLSIAIATSNPKRARKRGV
jgi:DNA transformation protein